VTVSTLSIVGVGLIGASVALAARRAGAVRRVVGTDRSPAALDYARQASLLEPVPDLACAAAEGDLVVFCTPVNVIAAQVCEAAGHCRPGTLLTDVGSTKGNVVRDVDGHLPAGVTFVGSHPIAGSEKSGPEHARADLFDGKLVAVTPVRSEDGAAVARVVDFWQALGARVEVMNAQKHDQALALTSHLPHLVASALAGVLPPEWLRFTGTGFRDTTRVASGSPALWTAIFRSNRAALVEAVEQFAEQLGRFRAALDADNDALLTALLQQGKYTRDSLAPR
jgi:prephenate dehydrogenase